jgi:hypothetical protein
MSASPWVTKFSAEEAAQLTTLMMIVESSRTPTTLQK